VCTGALSSVIEYKSAVVDSRSRPSSTLPGGFIDALIVGELELCIAVVNLIVQSEICS
jgi:hypothetical protein